VRPLTGRQHQIRVHLAAQGFPVAVDPLYGNRAPVLLSRYKLGYRPKCEEKPLLGRLGLHAARLSFTWGERELTVESELPKDLRVAVKQLGKWDAAE